jgi:hypothetical protein
VKDFREDNGVNHEAGGTSTYARVAVLFNDGLVGDAVGVVRSEDCGVVKLGLMA